MAEPFIKLMKNKDTIELSTRAPNAFLLLTQIALRAKRTNGFNVSGLTIGQALVGDYKSIGLTEQRYRTAKAQLRTWGFATFKGTNKGTIATLINSRLFDINEESEQRASQMRQLFLSIATHFQQSVAYLLSYCRLSLAVI